MKINQSFSQAAQDLFVLYMLEGKTHGTYLEIGSGSPGAINNTYLLESQFAWRGVSIDIDEFWVNEHKKYRGHYVEQADATSTNYTDLFARAGISTRDFDYASVDCDPPENTFKALTQLPFDTHRFAVITFEHDSYAHGDQYKWLSRQFLAERGYELAVADVKPTPQEDGAFEDWWVHPQLVRAERIAQAHAVQDWYSVFKDGQ